ncbi:TRAP transporter small permease [Candidatus Pelagibacter sp.]|jgi:TRAP-type C4-dicarboxylate transport system permease small subunit|nr:TRAP transporter small permease [Candidatus Pelagibacter sp.]
MNTIKKFIISSLTDDDGKYNNDIVSLLFRPIIATLYLIMIAITFSQVIFRYLLDSALPWAGELAIFFFIWIIFLGASIALIKGVHIGVDIFTNFLNKKFKKINLVLINFIIIIFCSLIIYGSIPLIIDNFSQRSPALEIRLSYVYACIPISMISMIFISIKKIVRIIREN